MFPKRVTLISAAVIAAATGTSSAQELRAGDGPFVATFLVKKKHDLSYEAFKSYQLEVHARLALALPGLKHYRLSFFSPIDGADQAVDAIAQVSFDSAAAYQEAMSSDQGQAALADLPNMLDMSSVSVLTTNAEDIYQASLSDSAR